MIGDDVRVVVLDVRGDTVRLGIEAPRSVQVHRAEVYAEVQAANAAAAAPGGDLDSVAGRLRRMARPAPGTSPRGGQGAARSRAPQPARLRRTEQAPSPYRQPSSEPAAGDRTAPGGATPERPAPPPAAPHGSPAAPQRPAPSQGEAPRPASPRPIPRPGPPHVPKPGPPPRPMPAPPAQRPAEPDTPHPAEPDEPLPAHPPSD